MKPSLEMIDHITIVVRLGERLDSGNAKAFKRAMKMNLAGRANVIFDLSELRQVDCFGLGAILHCLRLVRASGGDLKLYGMVLPVRALFELMRMHRILDLYNTREEALVSFRG